MAYWSDDFVGLPWRPKGRDRSGIDCYGLARLAWGEVRGFWLPTYTDGYKAAQAPAVASRIKGEMWEWVREVPPAEASPWDFILIRKGQWPTHIGLVTTPGKMLHIEAEQTSNVTRYTDPEWRLRVVGFYRLTVEDHA